MRETAYRIARKRPRPVYPPPDRAFTVTYERFERGLHEYYRAVVPGAKLKEYGLCDALLEGDVIDRFNDANVVVMSRPSQDWELDAIKKLQDAGRIVIVDTDDYPYLLWTLGEALKKQWTNERLDGFQKGVQMADFCTVSCKPMAERFKELGAKRVRILDNAMDVRSERWNVDWPEDDGKIRIGWVAGFTHMRDAQVLEQPVKRLLKKYPQLIFKSVGYMPTWLVDLESDRFEILPTAGLTDFASIVVGTDISLGPLLDTDFNEYRSSVKGWESICGGSVFVASNYGPYKRDLIEGKSAMLCDTEDDWVDAISELIEDPDKREKLWLSSVEELIKHSIDYRVMDYYWAYKKAITGSSIYKSFLMREKLRA